MKKFLYIIARSFIKLYWRIVKPKTYGSRAIVIRGNQILLVKNIGKPYWSLPGGQIEKGENPEQCLLRELREELGFKESEIKIEYKLGEYISTREWKRDTIHIFVISRISPDFQKQWELDDVQWFDINHLPKNLGPAASRRIQEYCTGKRNVRGGW